MPRVALFVTCLVDNVQPSVGVATVRLLEAAGCEVEFPEGQTCCGQPALNSGEPEAAVRLAKHFVRTFEPYDAVVSPSGSCAAMVHHWYERILRGRWKQRAHSIVERTFELTQYLVDVLGREDLGSRVNATVTVHDSCHGLRTLGTGPSGRRLLRAAGARIVEMAECETCCGFGGTFAVKHGEISTPMADAKLAAAAATNAECLTAGDSGCLLHLEGRRRRSGVGPPTRHIAEVLADGLA